MIISGHPGGNLWEIWGKLVNDWTSAKKKPAFVKVCIQLCRSICNLNNRHSPEKSTS